MECGLQNFIVPGNERRGIEHSLLDYFLFEKRRNFLHSYRFVIRYLAKEVRILPGKETFFNLPVLPLIIRRSAIASFYPEWCGILIPLVQFAIGLILLLKGADFTVRGAENLAGKLRVSSTTIGLTVVAFGTSLPELVVTSEAFRQGNYAIATGNVIGSNIANIGLVLGLVGLLMPSVCTLPASRPRLLENALLTLVATAVFILFAVRGYFDILSGIIFLVLFALILLRMWKHNPDVVSSEITTTRYPLFVTIAGLVMVVLGAELLLEGAGTIAEIFAIPPAVIGLSMVAVGTSLPELATSVVAAIQKRPGISIGNLLGSNIFNLLFVIGLNSLFFTIPVPDLKDILVMLGFTIGIFILFIRKICETRIWGILLLGAYLLYILFLYGII